MNVSRRVDYRSTQDYYRTPSEQKVTVVQRQQQNQDFRLRFDKFFIDIRYNGLQLMLQVR